jgi:uncharacterized protein YjcR
MATDAEGQHRLNEAARRRQAADLLRTIAFVSSYASAQLRDGLSPEQARRATVEAAGELAAAAKALRHLARLRMAERYKLALTLAGQGMPTAEIAARLGCAPRTVDRWKERARSGAGPPRGTRGAGSDSAAPA